MRIMKAVRVMRAQNAGTYFSGCESCKGHGHFVIASYGAQSEVFSRGEAWQQLQAFVMTGRVSMNHIVSLRNQVINSGLPDRCPPGVEERIDSFIDIERDIARFSHTEENRPRHVYIDRHELTAAVHEHCLASLPKPRLQ